MCDVCVFDGKLVPAHKSAPALSADGGRTIHGYYHEGDAAVLARHYPRVAAGFIQQIAELINHPRLLEVVGLTELVQRYREGLFSVIRGLTPGIKVASNPLSILYWSSKHETVRRVKTRETELMHGPMEKMSLRQGSLLAINNLLGGTDNLALTFACSCCAMAVSKDALPKLYTSEYYREREGLGRFFDSDVLTTTGGLFEGVSVADVPQGVLSATADFGTAEVESYLRFAAAAQSAVDENLVRPDLKLQLPRARSFLMGQQLPAVA